MQNVRARAPAAPPAGGGGAGAGAGTKVEGEVQDRSRAGTPGPGPGSGGVGGSGVAQGGVKKKKGKKKNDPRTSSHLIPLYPSSPLSSTTTIVVGNSGFNNSNDYGGDGGDERITPDTVQHARANLYLQVNFNFQSELTAVEMPSSPEEMQALPLINSDSGTLVITDSLLNPKTKDKDAVLSPTNAIMDGLDRHHHLSSIPSTVPPRPLSQNSPLPNRDSFSISPAFNPNSKTSLNGLRQLSANTTCTTTAVVPPHAHRATLSNSDSSVSIDSRSSPASDFEFRSASDEDVACDASDAPVVNANEIEGACDCPNAISACGNLKRQRVPSPDERCDTRGFGVRTPQIDSHSPAIHPRPMKKARIDESKLGVNGEDAQGLRILESCDSFGNDASRERTDNAQLPPRTRTPVRERERESEPDSQSSLAGSPPCMSVSSSRSPSHSPPFSRPPPPTRFQSTSSCSTLASGSSFPKTPPPLNHGSGSGSCVGTPPPAASCSFSPNNGFVLGSGPQQFWFEDGDLVLLVSPPPNPVVSPNFTQSTDPFVPSTCLSCVSDVQHIGQETTSAGPVPFRIHAARLALASKAFASLLSTKLSENPNKEDSVRVANEIAARLNGCRRNRLVCEPFYHSIGNAQVKGHGCDEGEYEYEVVGGCPAIRVEGDSPKDWLVALEAIYEPLSFQVRPIVFDVLARALRMSTRYGMCTLREWALTQLRTTWPVHVERMSPVALPHAADAIALARSCDVPDILPAAFYALAIQRWRPAPVLAPSARAVSAMVVTSHSISVSSTKLSFATSRITGSLINPAFSPSHATGVAAGLDLGGTDGGRAHALLDPLDLRRLVMGREALQDILVEIISNPLVVGRGMWDEDSCDTLSGVGVHGNEQSKSEIYLEHGQGGMYPPAPSSVPALKIPSALNEAGNGGVDASGNGLMSGMPSPALSSVSGTTEKTLVPGGMAYSRPASQSFSFSSFSSTSLSASNPFFPGFPSSQFPPSAAPDGSSLTTTMPRPNFTFCPLSTGRCRSALESLWRNRLVPDGKRPWGTWLAREFYRLATLPRMSEPGMGQVFTFDNGCVVPKTDGIAVTTADGTSASENVSDGDKGKASLVGMTNGVCASCWEENRRLALWRLDWLCAAIPRMFML
ncbi:hypothetical protein ACEPAG_9614 [Sanghuangporus baumii]